MGTPCLTLTLTKEESTLVELVKRIGSNFAAQAGMQSSPLRASKKKYEKVNLVTARASIEERIRQTQSALEADVREPSSTFKAPMAKRRRFGYEVTVGYH
jgi:hypothetical protein